MDIDSLYFEELTKENLQKVHQMCEDDNVKFLSQTIETFERATLRSDLFDPELTIVASDETGKVTAFFMFVLRRSFVFKNRKVAVLKFFVVDKVWRSRGVGTKIFNLLLEKIKEKQCFKMKMEVMTSMPDYWCPGLDPRQTEAFFFLKKLGFKKGAERINLCINLETISNKRPPLEHKGILISRATPEDKKELIPLKFMPRGYRLGFWPEEVALSFRNNPITTFIARDSRNKKVIGWASHSIHFPGSFGPTGVSKNLQGQGLGGVLLNWCLWDLKQTGLTTCKIMWVVENTVYFYLKSKKAYICEFFWIMKRRL